MERSEKKDHEFPNCVPSWNIGKKKIFFDRTIAEPINVEISESLRFPIPRFFESFTLSRFQKNFSKKTDSNDASFKKRARKLRSAARYQRSVISIPREAENVDKFAFTLPSKIDLVPNERKTRATNPPGYAQACPISPLVRNDMARPDEPLLSSPLPNPGKSPRVWWNGSRSNWNLVFLAGSIRRRPRRAQDRPPPFLFHGPVCFCYSFHRYPDPFTCHVRGTRTSGSSQVGADLPSDYKPIISSQILRRGASKPSLLKGSNDSIPCLLTEDIGGNRVAPRFFATIHVRVFPSLFS